MMETRDTHNSSEHLGSSLAGKMPGKSAIIGKSLEIQDELDRHGIYKPLGRIVVEQGAIDALESSLRSLWVDILHRVDLFASLPPAALEELIAASRSSILPGGAIVCRGSDADGNYYVVASGSVRVFKEAEGSASVTFAMLGPGEGFGEIALLTEEPRFASVETMERTCLIVIPRQDFLKAVFSNSDAAKSCARILAERLTRSDMHIAEASSAGTAYRRFISEQQKRDVPALIGNSPAVMKLLANIERVAKYTVPVLVIGEQGTELLDVAGLINMLRKDAGGLLMGLDAKSLEFADAQDVDVRDPLVVEMIQAGTLFGRGYNALPFAPDKRPGLIVMARNGMVVIENIEFLARRVQEQLADYIEKSWFHAVGETTMLPSNARIVATSSANLASLAATGDFDSRLYDLLAAQILVVPPLRKRKKDLSIIVDALIERSSKKMGKHVSGIEDEAYQAVMGYDWPGNSEELAVVIRRAVSICRGDRLILENIFIGPPPVTGKFTINLLQYAPVLNLFRSGRFPRAGLLITAPFILLLVGLGLFGPQEPQRNVALILTWGLWEPMLVLGSFFVARSWCGICPVGALSQFVRRTIGLHLKAPLVLRNYGFYFSAVGVASIIAAEFASGMLHSPRATALLVLTIAFQAALVGFLFQRSTWCRYLCPLGSMVGTLANCSILELRSNYGICNSTCIKHECYAGDENSEGCPMFEGPFFLTSNRNCALCGTCIRICPSASPVLNVRLPGYDLWTARTPDRSIAVVGLTLMGTQIFRGLERVGILGADIVSTWTGALISMALSVFAAALYARLAGRAMFGRRAASASDQWLRVGYVLLPLVFAFEAGYHLERLLTLSGHLFAVIGRQVGFAHELPGAIASSALVKSFQTFLIALGAAGSAGVLWKQLASGEHEYFAREKKRYWPVFVLALVYAWMFLAS
jgi:transcriptional regulator with AAA-type ATPase domain/polyferredoxin